MIGQTLGHHKILEKLGEGGMGEVYRAEDTVLGREVAIKVLPEAFTTDPERLARFEREAKLLASLNHPHIAQIHGLEEVEGQRFLVLELVEGPTLAERIALGPIPREEALPIALQIAEALEAAHEKGIIHRDLKPANVKLTPEGQVKVLDFGLAKALDPAVTHTGEGLAPSRAGSSPAPTPSMSPTLTASMTGAGVLLGTAAYMSPEQVRGQGVDKRSDIWAFGVVLWEMLTGRRLFDGRTVSDVLAAVLRAEPDLESFSSGLPPEVLRLLHRCLERDPQERLRDIGEARIVLAHTLSGVAPALPPGVEAAVTGRQLHLLVIGAALLMAAVAGALAVWFSRPGVADRPLRKLDIAVHDLVSTLNRPPVISPDGSKILYFASDRLWVRKLDQTEPRQLPGTEGARFPCWSPDSSFVAFVAELKLWKVPIAEGKPTAIAPVPDDLGGGGALAWQPNDRIIVSGSDTAGLVEVSAQGGDPRTLLETVGGADQDFHEVAVLPEGRGILFLVHQKRGIPDRIDVLSAGERTTVFQLPGERLRYPLYSPTGHLLYHRATTTPGLWAVPFSSAELSIEGEPFLVASDATMPSLAADGTLVYVRGSGSPSQELAWVDRAGEVVRGLGQTQASLWFPALSPDGRYVAATASEEGSNWDIWVHDLERGTKTRLTFETILELFPSWSPDGDQIVFSIREDETIVVKPADGAREAQVLGQGRQPHWSLGGRHIVYTRTGAQSSDDLWYLPLEEGGKATPLLQTPAREDHPQLSPDGRWLAYVSRESGREEIYLMAFPGGEGKWQVSVSGGQWPRWNRAGDELYYFDGEWVLAVKVQAFATPSLSKPEPLFSTAFHGFDIGVKGFDVAADGLHFLVVRNTDAEQSPAVITLVQNWFAEFASGD